MSAARSFNGAAGGVPAPEIVRLFLALAERGSNAALTDMIVEHGKVLLDMRDEKGRTALLCATEAGHSGALHLLVRNGADIDARDLEGNTSLMIAVQEGFCSVAQALLDRGADMELVNNQGQTALHLAASHRNNNDRRHPMSKKKKEAVQLLLERGAQTTTTDDKGHTPEAWARRFGYHDVANIIEAEEKRRKEEHAAQISVYTEGLPQDVTIPRLRLRHHHGRWR